MVGEEDSSIRKKGDRSIYLLVAADRVVHSWQEGIEQRSTRPFNVFDIASAKDKTVFKCSRGQEIRLNCVLDKAEVPAGFAIAIDEGLFPFDQPGPG